MSLSAATLSTYNVYGPKEVKNEVLAPHPVSHDTCYQQGLIDTPSAIPFKRGFKTFSRLNCSAQFNNFHSKSVNLVSNANKHSASQSWATPNKHPQDVPKVGRVTDNNCHMHSENSMDSSYLRVPGKFPVSTPTPTREPTPTFNAASIKQARFSGQSVPEKHQSHWKRHLRNATKLSPAESALGTSASLTNSMAEERSSLSLHSSGIGESDVSHKVHFPESPAELNAKEITFKRRNQSPTWDDPQYADDLKRSEYLATIPSTTQEKESMYGLVERLMLSNRLWSVHRDSKLDAIISAFNNPERDELWSKEPSDWLDYNRGTYPSSFSLPLIDELKLRCPQYIMELNLRTALLQDLQHVVDTPDAEIDYFNVLEHFENDPPKYLVHWGLVSDPRVWDRRKEEKKTTRTFRNDLTISKPQQEASTPQSLTQRIGIRNQDTIPTLVKCSATKHGLTLGGYHGDGPLRPIIKTTHLLGP